MLLPSLGIVESYGGRTSEYYNAFGLYLAGMSILEFLSRKDKHGSPALVWSCLNFIFFLASLSTYVSVLALYPSLRRQRTSRLIISCNIGMSRMSSCMELLNSLTSSTRRPSL